MQLISPKKVSLKPFRYSHEGLVFEGAEVVVQAPNFEGEGALRHVRAARLLLRCMEAMDRSQDAMVLHAAGDRPDDCAEQLLGMLEVGTCDRKSLKAFRVALQQSIIEAPEHCTIAETQLPITEASWRAIKMANGLEGKNRILSAFAVYFLQYLDAQQNTKH